MSSDNKYIDKLKYDPALNHSWFTFFTDKFRVVLLFIILFIVAGIIAFKSLPLESSPEVDLGIISINVVLPGASPESVEDLIVKKIEKEVSKVKDIDKMTSTSSNSIGSLIIQFKTGVDMSKALQDVKENVDIAKKNFPESAKEPSVKQINFSDTPIWIFSLAGKKTPLELNSIAKDIKDELEKIPNVSSVNISGGDEKEFTITYDPKKLEAYGLSVDQINQTIQATNLTLPIGDFSVESYKHTMTVDNRFYSVQTLKNIAIANIGDPGILFLRDVADVAESVRKRETKSRLSMNGSEPVTAVTLSVVKKPGGSIIDLVDAGQKKLLELKANKIIPEGVEVSTTTDQSESIRSDLRGLTKDFIITIILVCGTLFLFIGLKEALVPTLTIPIVFLLTFVALKLAGQTLNFLSLFSLVLSLGLLVDDAVLIVTGFDQYYKSGKFTAREAMLLALRDLKWPDISTTMSTVWIFAAMLFMTGIIGKFIFSIPFVIMVTLLVSLVLSLTIVPSLTLFFQGDPSKKHRIHEKETFWTKRFISFEPLIVKYETYLAYLLASRKKLWRFFWNIVGLFFVALSLPILGILRTEFFPADNQDTVYINLVAEAGQKLENTDLQIAQVEKILQAEPKTSIESFTTTVGSAASTGNVSSGGSSSSTNLANITVNLYKKDSGREETSTQFADRMRDALKKVQFPGVKTEVLEVKGGPPGGADLEVRITGDDFQKLNSILKDLKTIGETIPGVINITTSTKSTPLEFNIHFDTQKLSLNGLSLPQVASFLKMAIDGVDVTKIFKGSDEIVVRSWFARDAVDTLTKIQGLKIKNQKGQYVVLGDIMANSLDSSLNSITRIDQKRTVTLSATVTNVEYLEAATGIPLWGNKMLSFFGIKPKTPDGYILTTSNKEKVNKEIINYLEQVKNPESTNTDQPSFGKNIKTFFTEMFNNNKKTYTKIQKWPNGYSYSIGGEQEQSKKSVQSLLVAMCFGLLLIVGTIVMQFNSYKQSLLILAPIPLSLIGVFFGLTLTRNTLSFPSLIGLVALFGIVVNNSIVLIDKINLNRKSGLSIDEAILDAGRSRFEPIFLTSFTTIMGNIPLALVPGPWQSLAITLVAGLTTSGVLKLFIVPVLYKLFVKEDIK